MPPDALPALMGHALLTFRGALPGPLARLARDGVRAEGHFLGRDLLVRLQGPGDLAARLRDAVEGGPRVEPADEAGVDTFLLRGAVPERRLADAIEGAGGVLLPPLRWAEGRVEVDALQVKPGMAEAVRRAVPQVEVARKRPLKASEAPAGLLRDHLPLPKLTRKQAEALLAALDAGYYALPRRVTTLDVARKIGVGRSTFEEHLKKAEAQVVGALAPLARLQLLADDAHEGEALRLCARFSEALGLYVTLTLRGDAITSVGLRREAPEGAAPEHPYLARILAHLSSGKDDLADLPVDLEVSPFERRVLDAMRAIPPGEVVTYGELARRLGVPGGARAVGNACAHNPAPLVVPCHRVVPSDGTLGNYSALGGSATKAKLLRLEGAKPRKR